jgi:hypothetical protein
MEQCETNRHNKIFRQELMDWFPFSTTISCDMHNGVSQTTQSESCTVGITDGNKKLYCGYCRKSLKVCFTLILLGRIYEVIRCCGLRIHYVQPKFFHKNWISHLSNTKLETSAIWEVALFIWKGFTKYPIEINHLGLNTCQV